MELGEYAEQFRFLNPRPGQQITGTFDAVFASADIRIIPTPRAGTRGRTPSRSAGSRRCVANASTTCCSADGATSAKEIPPGSGRFGVAQLGRVGLDLPVRPGKELVQAVHGGSLLRPGRLDLTRPSL
jgi:hypothetical protein